MEDNDENFDEDEIVTFEEDDREYMLTLDEAEEEVESDE